VTSSKTDPPLGKGLVLTRKVGQAIQIGADITIRVAEIRRGQIRLRIIAPPELVIYRVDEKDEPRD
jgi:carbon storage regulator CsrA